MRDMPGVLDGMKLKVRDRPSQDIAMLERDRVVMRSPE
jgi:hypothetical protein